jgi:hypothetical protein
VAREALSIGEVLHLLRANPEQLAASTAGMSDQQAAMRSRPDDWSVNEILAHLRACADMWGEAIQSMLAEDHPRIKAINPRHWIHSTNYPERAFSTSLAEFRTQRNILSATLEGLTPVEWQRSATVFGAGKELERTVLFYAQWLARHERSHLQAIQRTAEAAKTRPRD